ncbi:MAG: DnaB-like helicase C-terminal domain-containing protein [Candidatus Omnitrophota bacterium]|jgi:replicative DNA helicase
MKITEILTKIAEGKKNLEFLPTGIDKLDMGLDGGFIREEMIVIGGFTGLGKSYLASQIMFNIARSGFNTAYFSLEITNQMILSRLIGQEADLKSIKVVTGNMTQGEYVQKTKSEAIIQGYEDFMDFYDDIYEFDKIIEQIKKSNYDFIVIDFIQNVIVKGMDEYERLSYIALMLQKIAKEKKCCILVLSQLSNSIARNIDGAQLEYKGSGSIATVCDLGFFLTRDFELKILTLSLRKNRRGSSGLAWQFIFQGDGGKIV